MEVDLFLEKLEQSYKETKNLGQIFIINYEYSGLFEFRILLTGKNSSEKFFPIACAATFKTAIAILILENIIIENSKSKPAKIANMIPVASNISRSFSEGSRLTGICRYLIRK